MPEQVLKSHVLAGPVTTEWAGSEAGQNEALRRVSRAISSYREPAALIRALADELRAPTPNPVN